IGAGHNVAKIFERNGLKVLIAENASWGNAFAGQRWYHMARNFHNSQGRFYIGEDARFDRLGIDLKPWRITPGETIILPQRGIGTDPIRMPNGFARKAVKRHGGRVRRHPGKRKTLSLEDDLVACSKVITWGSGAAIKALRMGIPCISYMPNWIGEQDNTDQDRLRMFRELAWAQWRHKEIENGTAFDYLLNFERGSGAV
ncbi:MAG: hypothetical protein KAI73_11535, partial [Rhodospirillaceae bacterium]|nr:hypothetical protein [Rhodospirillaceae bacterium]